MSTLRKQAISTGLAGYLTAPWYARTRAAELKGALKAEDEEPESALINRPHLGRFWPALLGKGVGALAGGAAGAGLAHRIVNDDQIQREMRQAGMRLRRGDIGAFYGVSAGLGAGTGMGLGSLVAPMLQQRAVNRRLGALKKTKPEVARQLRRGTWQPPEKRKPAPEKKKDDEKQAAWWEGFSKAAAEAGLDPETLFAFVAR